MDGTGNSGCKVRCLQVDLIVRDQSGTSKGQGYRKVLCQILSCQLHHVGSRDVQADDVRMLSFVEAGKIVDLAGDGDVVVIRALMIRELFDVPSFVSVWAQDLSQPENHEELEQGCQPTQQRDGLADILKNHRIRKLACKERPSRARLSAHPVSSFSRRK